MSRLFYLMVCLLLENFVRGRINRPSTAFLVSTNLGRGWKGVRKTIGERETTSGEVNFLGLGNGLISGKGLSGIGNDIFLGLRIYQPKGRGGFV